MLAALRRCGVAVHSGFLLAQWNDGEGDVGDFVTSASFTSNAMPLRVECNVSLSVFPIVFEISTVHNPRRPPPPLLAERHTSFGVFLFPSRCLSAH